MMLFPNLGAMPAGLTLSDACVLNGYAPGTPAHKILAQDGSGLCLPDTDIAARYGADVFAPGTGPTSTVISGPTDFTILPPPINPNIVPPAASSQSPVVQQTISQTNPLVNQGIVAQATAASFDPLAMLQADYGPLPLWMWLAGGVAALFLVSKK